MFRKYAAHFDTWINISSTIHERKVPLGSFIKHVRSDFVILDLPSLTACAYALLAYAPSPLVRAYVYRFFKRNMTEIYFVNFYQSKHRKQRYKIKKLLYQKMSNQNSKKSPGIEGAAFNVTKEMGMVNFGCLNSLLSLFYFHFIKNL